MSGTKLILKHGEPHVFTTTCTTDARSAVTKGLAEYLSAIVVNAVGGRQHRLHRVLPYWSEPEDDARYPSGWVYTTIPATFDASRFTPGVSPKDRTPDGKYIVQLSDLTANLTFEIWCTDPKEREALCMGIERAMNPVDWMYGFILELPHYFNQRAVFTMESVQFSDSEEDAMRRYRKAAFVVSAQLPVIRLQSYPEMKPRVRLAAVGTDVIVDCE